MVTLNFELTKEDYFQFYYYTFWLAPGKKSATIKSRIKTFLLFSLAFSMIKFAASPHNFDLFFFYTLLVLASIYILPLFSIKNSCRKHALAFYNNPLNSGTFLQTEMMFSETGIFGKYSYGECNYRWGCINKKVETTEHFLLYIGADQAFILPKRALKSEMDKAKLMELFGKHISFNAEVGHLVKE
jgi:YcxB-like protein